MTVEIVHHGPPGIRTCARFGDFFKVIIPVIISQAHMRTACDTVRTHVNTCT